MLIETREINNGIQHVHKFENGFGASVVRHEFSYGNEEGLWEMAVIEFKGDEWSLTYETPITRDVLGYLTDSEVEELLAEIESLASK